MTQQQVATEVKKRLISVKQWWNLPRNGDSLRVQLRSGRPSAALKVTRIAISDWLGKGRQSTLRLASRLMANNDCMSHPPLIITCESSWVQRPTKDWIATFQLETNGRRLHFNTEIKDWTTIDCWTNLMTNESPSGCTDPPIPNAAMFRPTGSLTLTSSSVRGILLTWWLGDDASPSSLKDTHCAPQADVHSYLLCWQCFLKGLFGSYWQEAHQGDVLNSVWPETCQAYWCTMELLLTQPNRLWMV